MTKIPGIMEVYSKFEFLNDSMPWSDEEGFADHCKSELYLNLGTIIEAEGYGRFDDDIDISRNRRRMCVSLTVVSDLRALSEAFNELETKLKNAEAIIATLTEEA